VSFNKSGIEPGILMKRIGGRWNREEKVWEIPYLHAVNFGLLDRIVEDKNVNIRNKTKRNILDTPRYIGMPEKEGK